MFEKLRQASLCSKDKVAGCGGVRLKGLSTHEFQRVDRIKDWTPQKAERQRKWFND